MSLFSFGPFLVQGNPVTKQVLAQFEDSPAHENFGGTGSTPKSTSSRKLLQMFGNKIIMVAGIT